MYFPNVLRPFDCTHMQLDSLHNKEEYGKQKLNFNKLKCFGASSENNIDGAASIGLKWF